MLADPESLPDVEMFDREVWRIESRTYLHSHRIELQLFFKYYEQTKLLKTMAEQKLKIHDLEKALLAGQLELHGNYIFGQSTGIFAPMIKDQALRFSLLKQALHTFNDETLTPQEQALRVYNTKGFGENNATGLGMIFHPDAIGLVNGATRDIMRKMGYQTEKTPSWQNLQVVLRSLHILLNTRDFIELDWFLYLYGRSL